MKERVYPHIPKSTKSLQIGDFWTIPLEKGDFACGRVIAFDHRTGRQDLRIFLAGLLDWRSEVPPNPDNIAGFQTLIQGGAHLRTILATGGSIRGNRPLEWDGISPALALCSAGGPHCQVVRGFECIRHASQADIVSLPVFGTFGFMFMRGYAEARIRRNY